MLSGMKKDDKSVVSDLAEAISSLDISKVAGLLSDDGNFALQDENYKIFRSDKETFLHWLNGSYSKFKSSAKAHRRLRFTIVQNMHSPKVHPIILFEDGRFPILAVNQLREEKSGLLIRCEDHKITGIDFCFLVMKTESPFIYEKRYLTPFL
jgi:hypothetical protein